MNGCGNDFMVIDNRINPRDFSKQQIIELADYKRSVGFDQLLLIENSDKADIAMRIFNNDGSEIEACGNGTRCVAKLVMDQLGAEHLSIATSLRILKCTREDDLISVNMGAAKIIEENLQFEHFSGELVDMGNPHVVIVVPEIKEQIVLNEGPKIEYDARFPKKANVNFARIVNPQLVELRTWERGAGATLSCGSGACASFYALHKKLAPIVTIKQLGGELKLKLVDNEICLIGDAKICYYGNL